jgi:hypothetical protein
LDIQPGFLIIQTIRYTERPEYKETKKKVKKYLERKSLLQMKTGWSNPPEIKYTLNFKPQHPAVFKNFAINSNRGN